MALSFIEKANQSTITETVSGDLTYVPSSCGLEVALPATTDNNDGVERKWVIVEYPANRNGFMLLDEKTLPTDDAQATFIMYKDPAEDVNNAEGGLNTYPGMDIRCTDNPRGLSLETYSGLLKTSNDLKMENVEDNLFVSQNGVVLEFFNVLVPGENGQELKDSIYVGVARMVQSYFILTILGQRRVIRTKIRSTMI